MKKQIFIIALLGFMILNFNALMAQDQRQERPVREEVSQLTDAQTKTVSDILADYDSEYLSADDAKAIMKKIKEAKIPGGKGIEKAIDDAGFDFEEIRKLAPPPARPNKRR